VAQLYPIYKNVPMEPSLYESSQYSVRDSLILRCDSLRAINTSQFSSH
jgi:hypothetical protein